MRRRALKRAAALCLALLTAALCLLTACAPADAGTQEETAFDLTREGLRVGVAAGTVQDALVQELCPDAEISYYEMVDGCTAVAQGKIDCYIYGKELLEIAVASGRTDVRVLDETVGESIDIALGISEVSQIPDLEDRVNAFLDELRADGTLDDMFDRWVARGDTEMPEIAMPQSPAYHLTVGTSGIVEPYTYYAGTELTGYDIELSYRLAAWLNADISFEIYDYGSIVEAARTGKVDVIAANLQVTPERAETLTYSEPIFQDESGILVKDTGAAAEVRWQDYNGKRLGVLVGPLMEDAAAEFFPDSEYFLFDSYPDCCDALLAGKIDAFLGDEPGMKSIHAEQPAIDYIHDNLTENNYSFAFRKDDPDSAALCAELNGFLAQCRADGTMQELDDIWLGVDEDRKVVDKSDLTGENGTIRVVTTSTDMPWSYIKDGKNVGYDIDLVVRFCRDRGYALELGDVDFAGRIPAIQSGRYDFTTDMNVTPEREEQVLFSDPTASGGIVLAVLTSDLTPAASGAEDGMYTSLEELAGKRIGILQGSYFDTLASEQIADIEMSYYLTVADLQDALKAGKIDSFIVEEPLLRINMRDDPQLTYIPEYLNEVQYGFVFPKTEEGRRLNEQFSAFIRQIRQDGTLDEIDGVWFGADGSLQTLDDYTAYPDLNGTLTMMTDGTLEPFTYVKDGQVVGYDIDIAARFCREYGYRLDVQMVDLNGILSSVQSGRCDFVGSAVTITEERKESVDFSEPYFTSRAVAAVLKRGEIKTSFLESVSSSFEKTFLREGRYRLFLEGIGTTLLITVLSILFGTVLGFAAYMACRNGNRLADAVTRFLVWLVQGMPVVVLLMILYYIIFARSPIDGTAVAVIGFTLVFGAAVYGMLRSGVGAVPRGQTEAAYALGYGNVRTFFRIILPQAIPHFFPAYKGEITSLIKATAIVGYIAVQDLTKMGDIVRGRTYEAFFPLIAVAVIYFVLAGILTFLVGRIELRVDPKRRKKEKILKGVETDDRDSAFE